MCESRVIIGHYIVTEEKEVQRCPSYYAADYEVLKLIPGRYEMVVTFQGGYNFPMPYWLLAGVDSTRISGAIFSGFGGVNFSREDLPAGEAVQYGIQMNAYSLKKLMESGAFEPLPERADLVDAIASPIPGGAGLPSWEEVAEMAVPEPKPAWRGA